MNIDLTVKKEIFNDVYLPYLETPERYMVFYGGGGSGKSVFAVQRYVLKYLKEKRTCLVCRNTLNTVKDSIFKEYQTCLSRFGILKYCKITVSDYTITLPNGSLFLFKGLDDIEKIKSISGIDDIMIEEATEISLNDFTQLDLRLRSKAKNQQITIMFNPVSKSNWVYKRFFKNGTPKDTKIVHTTWKDNKFLPPSYVDTLKQMSFNNPEYYTVYALGKFATLNKLIYEKFSISVFSVKDILQDPDVKPYFGLDFGYTNDATAFIGALVNVKKRKLWIFDEHYQTGMLNPEIARMIIRKGYAQEVITADSAEKKSIMEIKKAGIPRIKPTRKGNDSVLHGIQFIQQFEIIVHSRCVNTIEELENYCWTQDRKTNEYVNKPIDEYNHLLDALRYAVEDLSKGWKLKLLDNSLLGL